MLYDTDEHARSCKAMLLTITSIGICKKVTEIIFFKYCHFVSGTAPIYSQRPPTAEFVSTLTINAIKQGCYSFADMLSIKVLMSVLYSILIKSQV